MKGLYPLDKATDDLSWYLDHAPKVERDKIMTLVHTLNEAYVAWASDLDETQGKLVEYFR